MRASNLALNIRMISALSLLTNVSAFLSHRVGAAHRPLYAVSALAYSCRSVVKPCSGSSIPQSVMGS